jgi:hypothetical protein
LPPYISPFITLAKAIDWISKQDKYNRREATRRIIPVLADMADNSIPGWRWEDQRSGMYAVLDSRPDYPNLDRQYWQGKAPIRRGKVFDRWTKRWRTLLIPRQIIFQLWSEPSVASAGSESGKAEPITKAKGLGHAEIEIHQAFNRLFQKGVNLKNMIQKERTRAVEKECGEEFDMRTVQKYYRSWLEKHRTDA